MFVRAKNDKTKNKKNLFFCKIANKSIHFFLVFCFDTFFWLLKIDGLATLVSVLHKSVREGSASATDCASSQL